jgi:hypothetical protein
VRDICGSCIYLCKVSSNIFLSPDPVPKNDLSLLHVSRKSFTVFGISQLRPCLGDG